MTRASRRKPPNRTRRYRVRRDTILFGVGIAGIAYETLAHQAERPTLLLLFAAMVGLPAFLRSDEHHHEQQAEPEPEVDPDV